MDRIDDQLFDFLKVNFGQWLILTHFEGQRIEILKNE